MAGVKRQIGREVIKKLRITVTRSECTNCRGFSFLSLTIRTFPSIEKTLHTEMAFLLLRKRSD